MTRFHHIVILTTLLVGMLTSYSASALGKLGHQLVCQLAFEQLTPVTQSKVEHLLETAPIKQKKQINKYNYEKDTKKISFANACNWPDAIKREASYRKYKSWHYINVERSATQITEKQCKQGCITQAITYHQAQLKNGSSNKLKREALMFLGHWVGDIHQPMHVSFASDLGGNKSKITLDNVRCTNLHWLWDECLISGQVSSNKINQKFTTMHNMLKHAVDPAVVKQWQASSIIDWANESLAISLNDTTQYCQKSADGQCKALSNGSLALAKDYMSQHASVINQRILQAAARLAKAIEVSLR